ncbi:MAG: hypothetical protein HUJ61_00190 [Bacilli bacterium]|nr:hypothetical protein [Bacilli bacterium]
MEISRNEAQDIAMAIIYDTLVLDENGIAYDLKELICDVQNIEDNDFEAADLFVKTVVVKALINKQEIVNILEAALVNWKWERLPLLVQAILILSVAHYKYVGNVDKAIVINVAVKLCKTYVNIDKDEQHKFINGILDKVLA